MRYGFNLMLSLLLSLALVGCQFINKVTGRPNPPECKGEFRPVNPVQQQGASFDGSGKVVSCEEISHHG